MKYKIIVTGIGGVVGQGILRNIRALKIPIELIGVNITGVSAGNYLCDKVIKVPYAYDPEYISTIQTIVAKEKVDLIIPSTDYESYYLAAHQTEIGCAVAASPAEVTKMCLDKYTNYQGFKKFGLPFAESFLPSEYTGGFDKIVVKPREGRGSRNIYVNPKSPEQFDDSYLIQPYLEGDEITTTYYIRQDNSIHGLITFVRELELGNTAKAEVVTTYDDTLLNMMENILKYYPFRGSVNLQSRITPNGIIPFEINCRISGTNSVRSQFGFKDVQYTIQELLLKEAPETPAVTKGTALRVILDIIYPDRKAVDINNNTDQFYIN
ncbi:ATP-grasp domain-containing protein [Gynurincola endophyticus]|uniref:ATP-grasp domain-containing protein n=1 Tax=Gynurincola endophyticus TaxID=2479004 RepID=UPI000F8F5345|nr:ATP-grasp domain-containing protein [Gynurincola endophyticus]